MACPAVQVRPSFAPANIPVGGCKGNADVSTAKTPKSKARSREAAARAPLPPAAADLYYEISTRDGEHGLLKKYWGRDGAPRARAGDFCYRAIFGRKTPCEGCPLMKAPADDAVRTWVLSTSDSGASYRLALGRANGEGRAAVAVYEAPRELLTQLAEARVACLARSAGLSAREREVLALLMLGRSPTEIGTALGISVRTAKYHQTNILAKLGADSRFDLLRLVY